MRIDRVEVNDKQGIRLEKKADTDHLVYGTALAQSE